MKPVSDWWVLSVVGLVALLAPAGPAAADAPAAGLEVAARELAADLERSGIRSVAVVDFTDLSGRTAELGRFLADRVSAALAAAPASGGAPEEGAAARLRVVDRLRTAEILQEWKLSATGLLDPETGARAARIAGVEALVTGRITSFEDAVRVSLLALRAGSAEVLASATAEVPRTPTIAELERRSLELPCGPGGGAEGGAARSIPAGPPLQTVEVEDFEIGLHGCTRAGEPAGEVRCVLVAVNLEEDERNLRLEGATRAILADGRTVRARRVALGGWWATGPLSRVGSGMPPAVPVVTGVVLAEFPEGVERIERLVVHFLGFEAEFRGVVVDG